MDDSQIISVNLEELENANLLDYKALYNYITSKLVHDKNNYIFIDEALSEVDFELEKTIVKNILDYFKYKTIIYVSHKNGIEELFDKNIILRSVKNNG